MEFITISFLLALAVMAPGDHFQKVISRAPYQDKQRGFFMASGLAMGAFILALGSIFLLAQICAFSTSLFNFIKLIGASYLLYYGFTRFFRTSTSMEFANALATKNSKFLALTEGFSDSLLNLKALGFFLALFTVIIKPDTPMSVQTGYSIDVALLYLVWFTVLAWYVMTPKVKTVFELLYPYTNQLLGLLLMILGIHYILNAII